ncbi:hypothetical protein AUEXF2481DRAFT_77795 [Aureobasidium subglaciale EXF-2481]|uniref:Armadillo-like helical domain-containing protein n=1 Tax=Aureobasidium subglaciale (strain EXF-2481) TaxID=1043005 RepID=A0A074YUS5_AURSE|nr:uncharacterized protein AUEXF2481DRAFT_77795 [Aureobasidium subglaciale EXF-2481]KEQ97897.1 hypothetical protein AUEXF2481DRAFT_77795 [Aureobasidium subglaciale EXF-2481]
MEISPLTQQSRPDTFEPKVAQLYRQLFKDREEEEKSEGFWREFFLLKPDNARFGQSLDDLEAIDLLHVSHHCEQFVSHAIAYARSGSSPSDENALDNLTVFLTKVFSKRYTNPSSDIIEVLAGLDHVDTVFNDLVTTLDTTIKSGKTARIQKKAVQVALCVASGAFQTGLLTYFTQRDLFPSLMQLILDLEDPLEAAQPLLLAGLLANYNKFETYNPYHVKFADFVNHETMVQICRSIESTCASMRDQYVAIQDDVPEAWSIGGTLSYIGLGALAGAKPTVPAPTEDEMKAKFAEQPQPHAGILLTVYDFVVANKLFCADFVRVYSENKKESSPMAHYLSFCSYLYQHAYRSQRATQYAHLTLFTIQNLVEDLDIAKKICETTVPVRLSRQRPPQLPMVTSDRTLAANIIDIMIDSVNHNLRKKLDVELYRLNVGIILRLVTFLSKARIRLTYHWSELWRSLLSFVRFLTVYADDLRSLYHMDSLIHALVNLLCLSLTQGESFLPDTASYDDISYKLVEFGPSLTSFRDAYGLQKGESAASMNILIHVSKHYSDLIAEEKGKVKNLSPKDVARIIKEGYETLSIEAREGLDHWEMYREAEHKAELKRIARTACADARVLVL